MPKHKNRKRKMHSLTLDTLLVAQVRAVGGRLGVSFSQQVDEALKLYLRRHRSELVEALAQAGAPPTTPPPYPLDPRNGEMQGEVGTRLPDTTS